MTFTYNGANAGDDTINASITVDGSTQTATASKTWEESTGITGTMTGEGRLTQSASNKLDYAYVLDCTAANNSPPKFKGKRNATAFSLTTVTAVTCTDDPAKSPANPAAGFDTMVGDGTGKVGTTPVNIHWEFVDGGTAGTNDSAFVEIRRTSDNVVLFSKTEAPIGAYAGGTRAGRNTANP